jgi:hypothetical protein
MIPRPSAHRVLSLAIVLGAIAASLSLARTHAAAAECRSAALRHAEATRLAQQIGALRKSHQFLSTAGPPESDLSPRVLVAMETSGIEAFRLKSVRPSAESVIASGSATGGAAIHSRTVDVVLEPLAMVELGALLSAWHFREPTWPVTTVELRSIEGTARRFSARLRFTCTYSSTPSQPTGSTRLP